MRNSGIVGDGVRSRGGVCVRGAAIFRGRGFMSFTGGRVFRV